jgi:hypothetical protein
MVHGAWCMMPMPTPQHAACRIAPHHPATNHQCQQARTRPQTTVYVQLRCGTPDTRANTGDLCGLCELRSKPKRPYFRVSVRNVDTKCRRAGLRLRRNEIASSLTAACRREQKIEINSAIRALSLHYFCFAFACFPCFVC